jgi:hypothetical protein
MKKWITFALMGWIGGTLMGWYIQRLTGWHPAVYLGGLTAVLAAVFGEGGGPVPIVGDSSKSRGLPTSISGKGHSR